MAPTPSQEPISSLTGDNKSLLTHSFRFLVCDVPAMAERDGIQPTALSSLTSKGAYLVSMLGTLGLGLGDAEGGGAQMWSSHYQPHPLGTC